MCTCPDALALSYTADVMAEEAELKMATHHFVLVSGGPKARLST